MTEQDQFERLTRLFDQVVAVETSRREAEIVRLCEGDDDLAQQLRGWVAADAGGSDTTDPVRAAVANELETWGARADVGQSIGRYTILSVVGEGGMGTVYAVYDEELDRRVALKLMYGSHSERTRTRMLREAQAMAKLSHPNVVPVFEVGDHDGQLFLVMEFVKGVTLKVWRETDRSWREVLALYLQAGHGLAAAHKQGLVHRDFKPHNAVVGDDGRVRVLDFGLAARQGADDHQAIQRGSLPASGGALDTPLTKTGAVMGTPAYMPPEQFTAGVVDQRSDQFSFCVSLWEALYGERPFVGETKASQFVAVAQGTLPEPSQTDAPAALRDVLERGLRPNPEDRWATMPELLAALERLDRDTTRKRTGRRIMLAAGGASALGLTAFVAVPYAKARFRDREVAQCRSEAEREIGGIWNDTQQRQVGDSLRATQIAFAETTAQRTIPMLDAYATAWQDARAAGCIDARVDGSWTSDTLDRSLWCLEERSFAMASLVELLSDADTAAVTRAVTAAAALPRVGDCRDVTMLRALPATSEYARKDAQATRALLAKARALGSTNRHEESLEAARAALANATAQSSAVLRVAALLRVARSLDVGGKYDEAETVLEDAYFEALSVRDYAAAEEAASTLIFVTGYRSARGTDAFRWGRHAEAALAELRTDPGELRAATRIHQLAVVHDVTGESIAALPLLKQALAIREETLGADHPSTVQSLESLATVTFKTGDPDEGHRINERVLRIREELLGTNHPDVGRSLNNLGASSIERGDLASAEAFLQRALVIREAAIGSEHPDLAATHFNLCNIQLHVGRLDEAKASCTRAMEISEAALGKNHPDAARGITGLAAVLTVAGELERAAGLYERAVAIVEAAYGPRHPQLADSLLSMAQLSHATGDHARELEQNLRAIDLLREAYGPDHPPLAVAHFNVGNAYAETEDHTGARTNYERALELSGTHLGPDLQHLEARFGVARALVGLGVEHDRAIREATAAAEGYRAAGESKATQLAEIEAWLAGQKRD